MGFVPSEPEDPVIARSEAGNHLA